MFCGFHPLIESNVPFHGAKAQKRSSVAEIDGSPSQSLTESLGGPYSEPILFLLSKRSQTMAVNNIGVSEPSQRM